MKALVVGAGAQGGPAAAILSKQDIVTKIILGDINQQLAERWRDKIGGNKVEAIRIDASDTQKIVDAVKDSDIDIIFDFTAAEFSVNVMRAGVELKTHYVNSAASPAHLIDFAARKPLEFDEDFFKNQRTALLGCGETPGILNVIVREYCDKMDTVKSIRIRAGNPDGYGDNLVKVWHPTWSPAQQLADYSDPPLLFRDKKHQLVPIFSEPEIYDFGGRVGKVLLTHHSHDETYTLPINIGKGMEYCDFKFTYDPVVAMLVGNGFASEEEVNVKGVMVKPKDLVMAIVPKPADTAILDAEAQREYVDAMLDWCIHIMIEGTAGGREVKYKIETRALNDQGDRALDLFGVAAVSVPYSAVTGARMIFEGLLKPGIVWPDQLQPKRYFEIIKEMGLDLIYRELPV